VRIAYHLKIDAIISGINDEHQYNIMQSISCDYWQGDYIYMLNDLEQLSLA
jgi:EAL domain-containing protein (putative c-di-GMP-specific phosphodiesterase class I)